MIIEIYRGEAPGTTGTELGLAEVRLDEQTWAWLAEHGYSTADPDVWANVVEADEVTTENARYRIAHREI